jgi:glucosamine-6-phosphate deaminase
MKVLIFPDAAAAVAHVASAVLDQVAAHPETVLGLATGATMQGVHAGVVGQAAARGVRFDRVTSFNLDEYWRLPPDHPGSFTRAMRQTVFDPLGMDPARSHLPDGMAADPQAESARYESLIAAAGGIDLQLLGIGVNGHIGFNEPTSSLASRTRLVALAAATLAANRASFPQPGSMPTHALTMGIASILDARRCLLLALGPAKARAIAGMAEGPLSAMCPASALQLHPATTVVLDPAAASALTLGDYYRSAYPVG